jgi:hypothetical protein
MFDATREKTRLWLLILVGVVATLLGQTHAREIFAPSPHESGVFAAQTQASTGENYDGTQYDALDSLLAANWGAGAADDAAKWIWGQNKGVAKSIRQMDQRGWVPQQVTEAIQTGQQFPATNLVNKAHEAIRYVHPQTGQSVVRDSVTREIIHFGGPGFKY